MKKIHELTQYQREFAAAHINDVWLYLKYRRLPADEYYDVVIFGYLAAVQEYTENPELKRFKFRTIAFQQMRYSLCDEFTYQNRPIRNASTVSMNDSPKNGLTLDELLPARKKALQERSTDRMIVMELMSHLTDTEKHMVHLKARGLTYRELAEKFQLTPSGISSRFYRMRCRLSKSPDLTLYYEK